MTHNDNTINVLLQFFWLCVTQLSLYHRRHSQSNGSLATTNEKKSRCNLLIILLFAYALDFRALALLHHRFTTIWTRKICVRRIQAQQL